ncbi:hypothetical protein DERF_007164 [Dermatophagoides farinae]|uniref:JNK1/MAPK8-associated membrane protein n=1 Tax=Dermatophagoides farinae TaxID=6954 RepID=A0A922I2W2_DERFA|nr:hypothetical protein DERF_007164 [Dermatophagoides farinae]
MSTSCPGIYCGRIWINDSWSDCMACPRGFRSNNDHICEQCDNDLQLYDWIYLSFMVVIFVLIQLYFVDKSTRSDKLNFISLTFFTAIFCETILASVLSVLLSNDWKLELKTCGVKSFSDWYTLFYNPSLNEHFHCTNEAVYPLYSIVFLFYLISLGFVLIRHFYLRVVSCIIYLLTSSSQIKNLYSKNFLTKNIYYVLYSIPALMFIHAMLADYVFPYLLIIGSVISIAIHFSYHIDQSYVYLFHAMFHFRNLIIVLCHWALHVFGIVSVTEMKGKYDYLLLLLVPFPTLFYIFTSKFSDPSKL